jgi:hypothetical protein
MWHHGLDEETGSDPVGRITQLWTTPQGLMMRAVLDRAGQWYRKVRDSVRKGAVGLSSGSLGHLVAIDEHTGDILRWPVIEGSLTPAPACPAARITRHTIASATARAHYRAAGLPFDERRLPATGWKPRDGSAADALHFEAKYLRLRRRYAAEMVRSGREFIRQEQGRRLAELTRYGQQNVESFQVERDLLRLEREIRRLREALS